MQVMEFAAPVGCRNEVFTTVRLGKKWETRIKAGCRQVEMKDTTGNSIGVADILDLWVGPLSHVPAIFLESSNDPIARTWSGLHACLQGIYDQPITEKDHVTVMRLAYRGSSPTADSKIKLATMKDIESFGGRG